MIIKKELKEMFEGCASYIEVFKMISTAVQKGFTVEEVNAAASWRKNRIAKEMQQQYKKIASTEYLVNYTKKFAGLPVTVRDINSARITFTNGGFEI